MRRLPFFALLTAISVSSFRAAAQEPPPPPPEEPAPPPPPPPAKSSVVIDAKDDAGHDVRSVTVFVDDRAVAYELKPTPIELAPGQHTIAVQRNDGPRQRATATITLGEGETNHAVHLAFEKPPEPEPTLPPPDNAPIASRIVAGVGVVGVITGVVLLLARPPLPTNCNSDTYKCTKLSGETDAKFNQERGDAGTNRTLLTAGLATLLGGAGLTAAGVLWYVLQKPKAPTAMISPWVLPNAGGISLRASF